MDPFKKNPLRKIYRTYFPNPAQAMDDGLVLISDEINTEILLEAYSFGIFPWPFEDSPLLWFSPDPRGVLEFKDFNLPRSLKKALKNHKYRLSLNEAFEDVMEQCSTIPRKDQGGTWITPHLKKAYLEFHKAGYAHSVECWDGEDLVGGVYGVYVAGVFCGESMFYKRTNASKYALIYLIEHLISRGHTWMDIQMVTPVTKVFGGKYISRKAFLEKLELAKKSKM